MLAESALPLVVTVMPNSSSTLWPEAIVRNHWFAKLTLTQQTSLMDASRRIVLRDDQLFTAQGHSVRKRRDGFAAVVSGLLKVSSGEPGGREAILGFVRPGQWFGELALLDGMARERDARSMGVTELLVVEPDQFEQLMDDADFARRVTELLGAHTRLLLSIAEDFKLRSARARVARRLLLLAHDDDLAGGIVRKELDVSQDQLASMLGLTRQSIATQLRVLAAGSAIEQAYGRVIIKSVSILTEEANAF